MRVFITGGTGFIGSHVVAELIRKGDEVTILARNPSKIPAFQTMSGIQLVEGDLENHDLIRATLPGHQACIHNAIYWENEEDLQDTRAAIAIFQACAESGVEQVLYTSSTAVHRPFHPLISEEDRVVSNDFYGATKIAGEAFLSAISHQTSMRCNVIRPGPTVGIAAVEGGPVKGDRRFTEIVAAARAGEEIRVLKNEGRQFIGVADLAKVFGAVIHSEVNREVYVVVSKNYTTWESVGQLAVDECGSGRVVVDSKIWEPKLFDVSKIERDLGFAFDSTSSIRDYVGYLVHDS